MNKNSVKMFSDNQGFDSFSFRRNLAVKERKIMIYNDVDESSMMEAAYYLYRFRTIDLKRGVKKPIDILINSCGGKVSDGLSLISLIESMKEEGWTINTINTGYALSMGFLIGICGTNRYCYRYSTYMLHDVSMSLEGKFTSVQEELYEINRTRNMIKEIVLKYTNLTEEDVEEIWKLKQDKNYSAKEAVELGISDAVI